MMSSPSEYWDYDYPDMSQPHHPAHPHYGLHHPAPVADEVPAALVEEVTVALEDLVAVPVLEEVAA